MIRPQRGFPGQLGRLSRGRTAHATDRAHHGDDRGDLLGRHGADVDPDRRVHGTQRVETRPARVEVAHRGEDLLPAPDHADVARPRVEHLGEDRQKELFAELERYGVRQEDPYLRNITYRVADGRFCIIDFEFATLLDDPGRPSLKPDA